MATQRNKEDITIRQAWTELTRATSEVAKLRKGACNQVKNDALAQWVCFPHAWQSRLLRNVESMRQLSGLGLEVQKQTVGDMWQQTRKGYSGTEIREQIRKGYKGTGKDNNGKKDKKGENDKNYKKDTKGTPSPKVDPKVRKGKAAKKDMKGKKDKSGKKVL